MRTKLLLIALLVVIGTLILIPPVSAQSGGEVYGYRVLTQDASYEIFGGINETLVDNPPEGNYWDEHSFAVSWYREGNETVFVTLGLELYLHSIQAGMLRVDWLTDAVDNVRLLIWNFGNSRWEQLWSSIQPDYAYLPSDVWYSISTTMADRHQNGTTTIVRIELSKDLNRCPNSWWIPSVYVDFCRIDAIPTPVSTPIEQAEPPSFIAESMFTIGVLAVLIRRTCSPSVKR